MSPLTNTSLFTSCLRVRTPFTKPKAISFRGKKQAANTSTTILEEQKSMAARSAIWMYIGLPTCAEEVTWQLVRHFHLVGQHSVLHALKIIPTIQQMRNYTHIFAKKMIQLNLMLCMTV